MSWARPDATFSLFLVTNEVAAPYATVIPLMLILGWRRLPLRLVLELSSCEDILVPLEVLFSLWCHVHLRVRVCCFRSWVSFCYAERGNCAGPACILVPIV